MDVASARHELTAENLASAQMPGYRRRVIPQATFESMMASPPNIAGNPRERLLGTASGGTSHDFSQGHLIPTGRKLDVGISGDGFFGVDGPAGPLYTRNGSFFVDPQGMLMTVDGLPVRGTNGAIVLPPGATSETVQILSDGRLMSNGLQFAEMELTRFSNPENLAPAGSTLYSVLPNAGASPANVVLHQGFLESSNVSTVNEMADMINNSRHYDAAQKAFNTIAESIQKRIGLR